MDQDAAELTRGYQSELTMMDRLRGAVNAPIRLRLGVDDYESLRVAVVGRDWLGGETASGSVIVPIMAILSVDSPLSGANAAVSKLRQAPSLASVMRILSRRREVVQLVGAEGVTLAEGTIDRVGADHVDVAIHAIDERRRSRSVIGYRVIPLSSLAIVRAVSDEDLAL